MAIKMKTDLLLGFWRAAYKQPIVLPFETYKEANAFRLRLYVAVRPYRNEPNGDMELHCQINQLEAIASETADGKGQLIIRPAEMNEELTRLAKIAGIPWGFDQAQAEESQKRMLEALTPTPKPQPVTPEPTPSEDVGDVYTNADRLGAYDE
jgi:hypothetical protein